MRFTRRDLEDAGFVGWLRFGKLRADGKCPATGGVYVVTYGGRGPTEYPIASCGGWFKGRDPSVSKEALVANWVEGAQVVYIGKADQLRRRLRQFANFGAGRPVGHWGGRLIWQLPNVAELRVAWKETPGRIPIDVEAELIQLFRTVYGKPPFANDPHRLGR